MNESDGNGAKSAGAGISFAGLLTIAFIVLKLCGVIKWAWVWVLSPLWISTIIAVIIIAVFIIFMFRRLK